MTDPAPITSTIEFDRMLREGRPLVGQHLQGLDLRGRRLEGLRLGRRDGASAVLRDVDLTGATLSDCSLAGCTLEGVRLRNAVIEDSDLRYLTTTQTQLQDAVLRGVDLYRARLGPGTVLLGATLDSCSISLVEWDGVVIDRDAVGAGLAQEDPATYEAFLRRVQADGWPTGHLRRAVAGRHEEAAAALRNLSGYWSSRAQHVDATWAYLRARRNEAAHVAPWRVWSRARELDDATLAQALGRALRAAPTWFGNVAADVVCGHGERPARVVGALLAVVLLFAALFVATDAVAAPGGPATWGGALRDSVGTLTTTLPGEHVRTDLGAWLVAAETGVGIILLGLLGFVLGNRIRHA